MNAAAQESIVEMLEAESRRRHPVMASEAKHAPIPTDGDAAFVTARIQTLVGALERIASTAANEEDRAIAAEALEEFYGR